MRRALPNLILLITTSILLLSCSDGEYPSKSLRSTQISEKTSPITTLYNGFAIRGVWVQAESLTTQDDIDQVLYKCEQANINTLFAHIFPRGQSLWESKHLEKYFRVSADFDPLGYLVEEAHKRGIEIHGWITIGWIGNTGTPAILEKHPEWAMVTPEGKAIEWLNFTHPDYQDFIHSLIDEIITQTDIDGIHFDYLRYPKQVVGFDPFSISKVVETANLDPTLLRGNSLPVFGRFRANPLVEPTSANVVMSFSNGMPALIYNHYYAGSVIILNWTANDRSVSIGSQILYQSIDQQLDGQNRIFILHSETNSNEYGQSNFIEVMNWIEELGFSPLKLEEKELKSLNTDSVIVLPNVYLISEDFAEQLELFVRRGGRLIFIDGPVRSIHIPEIQAITGMEDRERYFQEEVLLTINKESPLIPDSHQFGSAELLEHHYQDWKNLRKEEINHFLKLTAKRINDQDPSVQFSVTITNNFDRIENVDFLDWEAWLNEGYVNFIVPRLYAKEDLEFISMVETWREKILLYDNLVIGVIAFTNNGGEVHTKSPETLLSESSTIEHHEGAGVVFFDFEHMTDEQFLQLGKFFGLKGD